ncbi:MAG: zinc ribbon domain-containing protein [Ignavibacteriaceae bacterium]
MLQPDQKKNKVLNKSLEQEREKEQSARQCPHCKASISGDDKFCGECGEALNSNHCPKCNAITYPGADICEVCGEWLLPGKCRFCYASISDQDIFCPECGNPSAGITCPKCGSKSFFDFCRKCDTPLSEEAFQALEAAKENTALQDFILLQKEAEKLKEEIAKGTTAEPAKTPAQLKEEKEKAEKRAILLQIEELNKKTTTQNEKPKTKPAPPKSLFSEEDKKRLDAAINRKNELDKKQKELIQKLDSMQNQTFETPQKARCFFNANKPAGNLIWECNYVHYLHARPQECARPDLGGKWIIDYGK